MKCLFLGGEADGVRVDMPKDPPLYCYMPSLKEDRDIAYRLESIVWGGGLDQRVYLYVLDGTTLQQMIEQLIAKYPIGDYRNG
jgi:hypothetical protein